MGEVYIGSDCVHCRVGHCDGDEWDDVWLMGVQQKNMSKDLSFMILYYDEWYLL